MIPQISVTETSENLYTVYIAVPDLNENELFICLISDVSREEAFNFAFKFKDNCAKAPITLDRFY